ncbi:hypothetical protein RQP46_008028 [Phenoliferia psychrophenolica]
MSSNPLFTPIQVGSIALLHRIALGPLTRLRAHATHVPSDLQLEYYTQRASPGGLLLTEGTFCSPAASGLITNPAIYTPAQTAKWGEIVKAVHGKGAKLVMQIYHMGRAADPAALKLEEGGPFDVVAPSPIALKGDASSGGVSQSGAMPREMTIGEIEESVRDHANAARNFVVGAKGDGVELHLGNGYLLDEFLQTNSNKRTDKYGGAVEDRTRFALEAIDAIVEAVGASKVGFRITPFSTFQDMRMPPKDIKETFGFLVSEIKKRHPTLAYMHVVEPRIAGAVDKAVDEGESLDFLHDIWAPKVVLVAGGLTPESARELVEKRSNVAVFGRKFISNPDLPARVKDGLPLADYDRSTFYGGGREGIDISD